MLPALHQEQDKQKADKQPSTFDTTDVVLSNRELEVIKHVALGKSNKEIADAMYISTHTVMSHRKNIARKLNIHSTAGLTIYAVVNGIVEV
jgi:regulator of cell morphogenesis and NO signaling